MRYARALNSMVLYGILPGLILLAPVSSADAQQRPDGVTDDVVERGRRIFLGDGFCYTCHGQDGRGVPNLGARLTDREWSHTDGSYEGLVRRIRQGVPAEESASGVPMPPSGGAGLTPDQVRAVAAYVWTLSRGG